MNDSPLLIAVHGWMLSRQVWEPFVKTWEQRGIPVSLWCPDLPGFGDRIRPKTLLPTLAAYGRWLATQALDRAAGRPFILMGHSLGGSVVLHAEAELRRNAKSGLCGLVCVAAGGGIYQPKPFRQLRSIGRLVINMRPEGLHRLPPPLGRLGPLRAESRAARGLLVNSTSRGAVRQLPGMVARLAVNSLWISGERDQVMEPGYVRHLAGYSSGHDYREITNCGHLPMREQPEALCTEIETWLIAQSLARPRS